MTSLDEEKLVSAGKRSFLVSIEPTAVWKKKGPRPQKVIIEAPSVYLAKQIAARMASVGAFKHRTFSQWVFTSVEDLSVKRDSKGT